MLYNAGVVGTNRKHARLKRWVHFRWAVVLSCFFLYFFVQNYMLHMRFFFSFSISVFLLCIGIGIILFQK